MDSLLRLIEESDKLILFFAQCPAGKRGRPLSVGSAVAMEKASPGSVCAKEASARRGVGRVGARTVFYRTKTYSDKLRGRMEKERAKKDREATGAFEDPKDAQDEKEASFPILYKSIKGSSPKQIGFSKKLVKDYRSGIKELSQNYPKQGKFFTEAWKNLHKIEKTGDLLERRGLDKKHLLLTLLSRPSIKALSKAWEIDITKEKPNNFAKIMARFFKDDEEYNIAKEKQKQAAEAAPKGDNKGKQESAEPKKDFPWKEKLKRLYRRQGKR